MKIAVRNLESTPWDCSETTIFKVVRMATDLGVREYMLMLAIHAFPDGRRVPMTAITFNHRITMELEHDGSWFNVVLKQDKFTGAQGAFLCSEREVETRLVCEDPETFTAFSGAFATSANWTANIEGVSGTLMSFLVPPDSAYQQAFDQMIANAKKHA